MNVAIVDSVLGIGSKLIDRLFPDPEQAAKAKYELLKLQQEGDLRDMEVRLSAIIAEAKSADKWTSRARPSFLYLIYGVIMLCFIGGIIGVFAPDATMTAANNVQALLAAVPEALWGLFGAGYLGYSGARSLDKHNLRKQTEAVAKMENVKAVAKKSTVFDPLAKLTD